MSEQTIDQLKAELDAMSSDCGRDYCHISERDELKEKLKRVSCMYCRKEYGAEQSGELANHIMSCDMSPLVQMVKEMESRIIDYMDLMNDEFMRIVAITDNAEVVGICQRAMVVIAQKEPVIKQRDDALTERDALKSEVERLREALDKVRGFGRGDMGAQQLADYVTEVADEALEAR